MMTPREILTEIFSEEVSFDTSSEAADLMLDRLAGHGFRIVPSEPTAEMKVAWRKAQKGRLQQDGPVMAWQAMLDAVE